MQPNQEQSLSFEEALSELEHIVRDLEDGQVGLEESLAKYEKGVGLLKKCFGQLKDAERRILLLTGQNEDGEPILRPFEHASAMSTKGSPVRRNGNA